MMPIRRVAILTLQCVVAASCSIGHGSATITSLDGSFDLQLPARWAGHVRVDSLSTAERATARPGAMVISYLPVNAATHVEALVAVAVYDSAAWVAVRAEEGPPPGDSVMAAAGRVYVVAQPQSNPFGMGSPDSARFAAFELQPGEIPALIHLHPSP